MFLNGNTFAELGKILVGLLLLDLPQAKLALARSFVGHMIAGVMDEDVAFAETEKLLVPEKPFKVGDAVETLKGSSKGVIQGFATDGRIRLSRPGLSTILVSPDSVRLCFKPH